MLAGTGQYPAGDVAGGCLQDLGRSGSHRENASVRIKFPVFSFLLTREPGIDFPLGFVLRLSVALLEFAGELLAIAVDYVEVITSQPAPLRLNVALELFPVTFDPIPIHYSTSFLSVRHHCRWQHDNALNAQRVPANGSQPWNFLD
jgi:hypothetical protein